MGSGNSTAQSWHSGQFNKRENEREVKAMLNKKARNLIGYDGLVSSLAADIPVGKLEELEIEDLKERLGAGYERWEFKDWYRLLTDIKRKKGEVAHEILTEERIFNSLPWAAQQAAQEAVRILMKKAADDLLFKMDETTDVVEDILWNMFYCMKIDIKDTAQIMQEQKRAYSYNDLKENKLLLDFIRELRKKQWHSNGEVARLRNRTNG